ncbi:hypothetical protein [Streptomyces sp. NPDC089919]|uniref:hypothetical protein n=1 Tax=Streptomyces sp. NPDC089919 TaxID=3155188 RepID=UPI00342DA543
MSLRSSLYRWVTALTVAVLAVAAGTASAAVRPGPAPASVALAAAPRTAAGTSCFQKVDRCVSSDPTVSFKLVSRGDTSSCTFSLTTVWGDGATDKQDFNGGADGAELVQAKHKYTKPSPFLAPKTYAITWNAAVVTGLTCRSNGGPLTFVRTCTDTSLSGAAWAKKWPSPTSTSELTPAFRKDVDAFIGAMRAAGIRVQSEATFRPFERAYMMNSVWNIVKKKTTADKVPVFKPGKDQDHVNICWQHTDANGVYDPAASLAAAGRLYKALGISAGLKFEPALKGMHTQRKAIDMGTTWTARSITVRNHAGQRVTISSGPHDGTNAKLIAVGATYGVLHIQPASKDTTHWSTNGH